MVESPGFATGERFIRILAIIPINVPIGPADRFLDHVVAVVGAVGLDAR